MQVINGPVGSVLGVYYEYKKYLALGSPQHHNSSFKDECSVACCLIINHADCMIIVQFLRFYRVRFGALNQNSFKQYLICLKPLAIISAFSATAPLQHLIPQPLTHYCTHMHATTPSSAVHIHTTVPISQLSQMKRDSLIPEPTRKSN